jgi:hypothetical protein
LAPKGGSADPSLVAPLLRGFFSSINESTLSLPDFLGLALSTGSSSLTTSSVEGLLFLEDEGLLGMRDIDRASGVGGWLVGRLGLF